MLHFNGVLCTIPRRNAGLWYVCTGGSTKLRKKIGSSVAYKTIGTFLPKVRRKDARGQSTKQAKAGAVQRYEATTAKRWYPDPTIDYTLREEMQGPPPPGAEAQDGLVCKGPIGELGKIVRKNRDTNLHTLCYIHPCGACATRRMRCRTKQRVLGSAA